MNTAEMRVVQNTLYVDLVGLKENTIYSYYYEFFNGFNSMRSATKTFKTEASPVTPPEITLPTVVTAEITEITANSAKGGGEVTNDGGAEVTERGICWSTNANPTLNDSHIASGTGIGAFTAMMNSLEANTTYHVRAYATNEKGTAYGLDREFTTLSGGGGNGDAPTGAINGLFTINENGDQVYFSQGNLQYQASTNTWRFAEHQWDYVAGTGVNNHLFIGTVFENGIQCDNTLVSATYDGWIDLFAWGTSGWDNGNVYYQPWDYQNNGNANQGFGYGPTDGSNYDYGLVGSYKNADWGVYNAISNGGNQPGIWRTWTKDEIDFVFNHRNTISGIRYAAAQVDGIGGVVLLPDDWKENYYSLNNYNQINAVYDDNIIDLNHWINMEQYGAVFLPITGSRVWNYANGLHLNLLYFDINPNWNCGCYWSIDPCDGKNIYGVGFSGGTISAPCVWGNSRSGTGFSVRLIHEANK